MKSKSFSWPVFLLLFITVSLTACEEDDEVTEDTVYTISAALDGAQEVPAPGVPTTATGSVTGFYDASTNTLQYTVKWTGLTDTASMGHFHGPALPGETAPPTVTLVLVNNGLNGTATGTTVLTDEQESDFLAGKWYANIYTPNNTPGEIRGQVSAVN